MKILVVGISVRAMVESAVHGDYSVIALDAFGDQDLKAMAECHSLRRDFRIPFSADALYRASREFELDAVAYTSNLENHPEVLERFARSHRLIGNSPETIRSVRHWPALFPRLGRAGFRVPETVYVPEGGRPEYQRRWLVKPVLSGGGHGISFLHERRFERHLTMLQQFIPGKACSASFVANGRESAVIGITEQLIGLNQFGAEGFRYCGNILPLPEMLDPDTGATILEHVRRTSAFLTREYGLTGVNGFDFILDGNQVWLTEVNPRYSASMELIEQAYNLNIFHLHVQSVVNGVLPEFRLEPVLNTRAFFGKGILFSEKDATAPDTMDWRARGFRDIPEPGEKLRGGSPVCTLLAGRPTYEETLAELIRQAGVVRGQIYG